MRIRGNKRLIVAFTALTASMVAASAAWACTAQTYLNQVSPRAAAPRSSVTLEGSSINRAGLVEIRWNSVDGPRVDVATTGAASLFQAQVIVPDVAPGVYYLVVVSEGQKVASAPFEVVSPSTGESAVAASTDLWGGFDAGQPSVGGLGGVSPAANGPQPGLLLGGGLLAVGVVALLAAAAVIGRSKRRATQAGNE